MKRYLRKTIFTLLQALVLYLALLFVLYSTLDTSLDKSIYPVLFFAVLLLILICKRQLFRLKLFYVRHFSIRRVDRMSGEAFEDYMKIQFEYLGFKAATTKASNDYGADLILRKKGTVVSVQCKRYQSNIGVRAIQEVIGSMAYYNAERGLVVTNSFYTRNAAQLALANHVILWDRDVLIQLIGKGNMSAYVAELLEHRN